MSYAEKEVSLLENAPAELYEFQLGGQVFRYTSQTAVVSFGGFDYEPVQIKRNNPKITDERSGVQLLITVPTSLTVARSYLTIVPASRMTVTIYRQHRTDGGSPETVVFWKGFVTSCKFKDEIAELICEPIQALFSREIPRQSYQAQCNHVLFDDGCQVSKISFSDEVEVTSIDSDGVLLTLDSLSGARPSDSTFFTGGYVERLDGDRRLIFEYTFATDQVRILLPFDGLEVGETVTARAGCAHDPITCRDKFDNIIRYGGFPWMPEHNLFEIGVGND